MESSRGKTLNSYSETHTKFRLIFSRSPEGFSFLPPCGKAMRKKLQKFQCRTITPIVRNMDVPVVGTGTGDYPLDDRGAAGTIFLLLQKMISIDDKSIGSYNHLLFLGNGPV